MHKYDVDTPALLLDVDVMDANIAAMASWFAGRQAGLRPHFKTPKTPEVARRQLAAGAIGITAAKVGEAEVLARAGLGPILIANQVVGRTKIDRLLALPEAVEVIVAVESEFNIRELEEGAARSGRRRRRSSRSIRACTAAGPPTRRRRSSLSSGCSPAPFATAGSWATRATPC